MIVTPTHAIIPLSRWGKDHWSTLLYLETVVVDHDGRPKREKMRCDAEVHPVYAHIATGKYPTRLNDGVELAAHDDWNCVDDMEAAGLLTLGGTGLNPKVSLTEFGWQTVHRLRRHVADGGKSGEFRP